LKKSQKNKFIRGYGFEIFEIGCPALGVWVAFLKQSALPGEATQTKNKQD
jgi:hypothetical protein